MALPGGGRAAALFSALADREGGAASAPAALRIAAEDAFVDKPQYRERNFEVPDVPRSTYLMVFSPDGTKVASTHGNHNIYISELSSGKHLKTLSGHPRTPWCISFHPSHPQLLASGCLGGQVRVWDLSGGSEVWNASCESAIASIAFHPRDHLLVIATCNEIHFWDWSLSQPFTKIHTNSAKVKVRFVAFDPFGDKLITGISCWSFPASPRSFLESSAAYHQSEGAFPFISGSHEHIVNSYRNLVQRYSTLIRTYHHLIMGRSNTIDRGTDPMEVDSPSINITCSNTSNRSASSNNQSSNHNQNSLNIQGTNSPSNIPPMSTSDPLNNRNSDGMHRNENSVVESVPSTSGLSTRRIQRKGTNTNNSDVIQNPLLGNTSINNSPLEERNSVIVFNRCSSDSSSNMEISNSTLESLPSTSNSQQTSIFKREGEFNESSNKKLNSNAACSTTVNSRACRIIPTNTTSPVNNFYRHRLSIFLRKVQDFMEHSIDQTLDLCDFYGVTCSSTHRRRLLIRGTNGREINNSNNRNSTDNTNSNINPEPCNDNMETRSMHAVNNILNDSGASLFTLLNDIRNCGLRQTESSSNSHQNIHSENSNTTSVNQALNLSTSTSPSSSQNSAPLDTPISENQQSESNSSNSRNGVELSHDTNHIKNVINTQSCSDDITASTSSNSSNIASGTAGYNISVNSTFQKVTRGVNAIERHTEALITLWSRGNPSLRRIRGMWEDLRREIIALQSTNQESPHFSLSALERCQLLNNTLRSRSASETSISTPNPSVLRPSTSLLVPDNLSNTTTESNSEHCSRTTSLPSSSTTRINPLKYKSKLVHLRALLFSNVPQTPLARNRNRSTPNTSNGTSFSRSNANQHQFNMESTNSNVRRNSFEVRRNIANILARRYRGPPRQVPCLQFIRHRELGYHRNTMNVRRGEVEITRDRVRMRARRILGIMCSLMMNCLEEEHLSNRIILMLKSLKKALSVTCFLLLAHLFSNEQRRSNSQNYGSSINPRSMSVSSIGPLSSHSIRSNFVPRNHSVESNDRGVENQHIRLESAMIRSRAFLHLHPVYLLRRRLSESPRMSESPFFRNRLLRNLYVNNTLNLLNDVRNTVTGNGSSGTQHQSAGSLLRQSVDSYHRDNNTGPEEAENNEIELDVVDYFRRIASRQPLIVRENTNSGESTNNNSPHNPRQNISVPSVRINDVPVSDMGQNIESSQNNPLQPRIGAAFQGNQNIPDEIENRWQTSFRWIQDCPSTPAHRIQVWNFSKGELPNISDVNKNIVVRQCKIHNDANIDISQDGRLLVALLPAQQIGIFSLEWDSLGKCLYTILLEQNSVSVSVSLSPCARHLAVGLGLKRVSLLSTGRRSMMAIIYRLETVKTKGILVPVKALEQSYDAEQTSLNCLRWAPQPGQGLVYGNNTGQLIFLS